MLVELGGVTDDRQVRLHHRIDVLVRLVRTRQAHVERRHLYALAAAILEGIGDLPREL